VENRRLDRLARESRAAESSLKRTSPTRLRYQVKLGLLNVL
jgi:hypothetical protein